MVRPSALCFTVLALVISAKAQAASLGLIELPQKPIAPVLRLADLTGKIHQLEAYRGNIVVVHFWATWCAPCRRELPALQKASEELLPEGVAVLAINVGEASDRVRRFLSDRKVTFSVLTDPSAESRRRWQVNAMPTTYIVDQNGVIFFGAVGERNWAEGRLMRQILSLKDATPQKWVSNRTPKLAE